ncbi:MAG: CocE/NonD family hydrolase [Saprospiraceae bacterium]
MKKINYLLVSIVLVATNSILGQKNLLYENLPVGKYAVGFKIITLTDDSRVIKPEYNYLGEKNEGDLTRKITIHLWYPAIPNTGNRTIKYNEYCYNHLITANDEVLPEDQKKIQWENNKSSLERWFGKLPGEEAWNSLLQTNMLAKSGADHVKEKLPLLIGMLRPMSTTMTNELLASNGYVIAMIVQGNFSIGAFSQIALNDVPSLQQVIAFLKKDGHIDEHKIGTFGFSGSGFIQVLLAMHDVRIKALADMESAIFGIKEYMVSNYYNPMKLKIPFMHIYSKELAGRDTHFEEFYKMKFSKRYHVILNQPEWQHWNVATEGYTSCVALHIRGKEEMNIQKSFEVANIYLLNFFNAELKSYEQAKTFLSVKPVIPKIPSTLWDIDILNPVQAPPNKDDFENIIRSKGIQEAITVIGKTLSNDSTSELYQGFILNRMGYTFLNEQKMEAAIGIFKLNTELHPEDANWFDSLAEAYEVSGNTPMTKQISQFILDMLNKKSELNEAEKSLKETALKRLEG